MATSSHTQTEKIGFFGGSFDPIHKGHLRLAELAILNYDLDLLYLCPAHQSPLKEQSPWFDAEHRLAMTRKAASLHERISVLDFETANPSPSYTRHSIVELKKIHPNAEIFLLIGYDQFRKLPDWKFVDQLCEEVHFILCARHQTELPPPPLPKLRLSLLGNSLIDLSSTEIRSRMQTNQCIRDLVPPVVYDYLRTHPFFPAEIS